MLLLLLVLASNPGVPAGFIVPSAAGADALPADAVRHLDGALDSYERIRKALGSSQIAHVDIYANQMGVHLGNAAGAIAAGHPVRAEIERAREASRRLAAARQIVDARGAFAEASAAFVALARAETRLRTGRALYACPSGEGAGNWLQPPGEPDNPYLGDASPSCGEPQPWEAGSGRVGRK